MSIFYVILIVCVVLGSFVYAVMMGREKSNKAQWRESIRDEVDALANELGFSSSVSTTPYRVGQWELCGHVAGRAITVWISNGMNTLSSLHLNIGRVSAADRSEFGFGGMHGEGWVPCPTIVFGSNWLCSGDSDNLLKLNAGLREWIVRVGAMLVDGELRWSSKSSDLGAEIKVLEAILD